MGRGRVTWPSILAVGLALSATLSLLPLAGEFEDRGSTLEQLLSADELEEQARILAPFALDAEGLWVVLEGAGDAWSEDRVRALRGELMTVPKVRDVTTGTEAESLLEGSGLRLLRAELAPGANELGEARRLTVACAALLSAAQRDGERAYVLGTPRLRAESWRLARSDLLRGLPLLLLLALVLPWAFFGSLTAGLFALLVAACTCALTLWAQRLLVGPLSSMALLVVPMLWAVATMDALHLVGRTRELARDARPGTGALERARRARRELLAPCLVTSLTSAAGFGTLGLLGESGLIRNLGLSSAVGVLVAYGITFLLGPALLALTAPGRAPRWPVALGLIPIRAARRAPRRWILVWGLLVLAAVACLPRLRVAGAFPEIFDASIELQADLEHLGDAIGTDLAPLEISLEAVDETGRRASVVVSAALALSRELRTLPGVRAVLPVDLVSDAATLASSSTGLDPGARERELEAILAREELRPWIDATRAHARVQVHLGRGDWGQADALRERLERFDAGMLTHHRLRLAGPGQVAYRVQELGLGDLRQGVRLLGVALVLCIALALGSGRRRPAMTRVGLGFAVSALPLLATAALWAVTGTPWSLTLLPLPGVLLGIAVDDSVHLLWRPRGRGRLRALPAITATTLLVAACVLTLTWSSLAAHRVFGASLAFGLAVALAADLTLLPAVLRRSRRRSLR